MDSCGQAHCLVDLRSYLQPWRGTARGLRSFRICTTTRMQLEGHHVPCKQYSASGLIFFKHIICTEDVTAVRRTLQRLRTCSRDTVASSILSSPYHECQLIDILHSLLVASICGHRGRHRRTAVIHACLQTTRGRLCLKANLNFCARPSGGRFEPQHIAKDC